jgi:lipopolysaccharide transport system ATP-binding protein
MSAPAVRTEGVAKRYRLGTMERYPTLREALVAPFRRTGSRPVPRPGGDTLWALRDVSFEVERGEVLGVIGRNGAGKSTLLKILSRITEPTAGLIELRGRVGSLLEVGTGVHPELTGRENVFLNGAILGMRRAEIARQFDAIVAFAETERFVDTPVKYYSSGMYMRLAFAVAAHLEPEILIVDEVLAVGDAAFQRKCLGRMDQVAYGGRTVLFVSHNLDAVRRLCRRTLLLQQGKVEALGPTADVLARYLARAERSGGPDDWLELAGVHRTGSGAARFTALRYTSRDEAFAGHPYPNGPLVLEVVVDSTAELTVDSMAVNLSSAGGTLLLNADIMAVGREVRLRPGRNLVRFELEAVPLAPGTYACGLWLGPSRGAAIDHVDEACWIEVVDATGPGLGTTPSVNGLVACRFRFDQLDR